MRCDQCKHWDSDKANEHWEAQGVGFGWCKGVRERWRIQDEVPRDQDLGDAWAAARVEHLKKSRAYVQDGSEYVAELFTAPDFFCALFTAGSGGK